MIRLIKTRQYLMKSLGLLLLSGFIAFGAAGNSYAQESATTTIIFEKENQCDNIVPGGVCVGPGAPCPGGNLITGGGCACSIVNESSIDQAPIAMSIPAGCSGNLEIGGTCSAWECLCLNDTDSDADMTATTYMVCLDTGS